MKRIMLIFFILVLTLVSCKEQTPSVIKSTNHTNTPISITVVVYENSRELNKSWKAHAKLYGLDDRRDREGFAWWIESRPYKCEIHVVDINRVEDAELKTWGHELAHCVYGSYHKDSK